MQTPPENSRESRFSLNAGSKAMMPPAISSAFTAPAYNASTDRHHDTGTGLWSKICFVAGTLFGFRGRVSRLDYWIIGTAYTCTSIVGYLAFGEAVGSLKWADITATTQDTGFVLRFFVFCFVMIMLRLSLEARRFQDRGHSGYWYFGYFIPVLNIYLVLANSFFRGSQGANRYDL